MLYYLLVSVVYNYVVSSFCVLVIFFFSVPSKPREQNLYLNILTGPTMSLSCSIRPVQ